MGLEYEVFLNQTWKEYDYCSTGYLRRVERQWDYTRHVIASNFNSSGFTKKTVKPKEVMELPHLDKPTRSTVRKVSQDKINKMLNLMKKQDG